MMAWSAWRQMSGPERLARLLAVALTLSVTVVGHEAGHPPLEPRPGLQRHKRAWNWHTLFVGEETPVKTPPVSFGKLNSDKFNVDTRYVIDGDGANSIFTVNSQGDLFANKKLDREVKSHYFLNARLLNIKTNLKVEEDTAFSIQVQDINDNLPVFPKSYNGTINEGSPIGTEVLTVTATDEDDPTLANGMVEYKLLNGTDLFSINSGGVITSKVSTLDRESQSVYSIAVQAKDLPGQTFGGSATTIVTITVGDINDNLAIFKEPKKFTFDVREDEKPAFKIGTLEVEDQDEEQNKDPSFTLDHAFQNMFEIVSNPKKDGILTLKQGLDYETRDSYRFNVLVREDRLILLLDNKGNNLQDKAEVVIRVIDVDEPPVFKMNIYNITVWEGPMREPIIGTIEAKDPDKARHSLRYSIEDPNCPVKINPVTGQLSLVRELDRELMPLHKFQVTAKENSPSGLESYVTVNLIVADINDNKPELTIEHDIFVCENDKAGTVIGSISATDKDDHLVKFSFTLSKQSSNFSLHDNSDNTASINVKQGGFSTEDSREHLLEIQIEDGGKPSLKSITPLPIRVCSCHEDRKKYYCKLAYAQQTGVSVSALIAILLCILTILVIVILIVMRRRYQKDSLVTLGKATSEIHEQLVTYDEEGGGEMDTNGYDVSILTSARHDGSLRPGPNLYAVVKKPSACKGDMAVMIEVKKDEADHDRDGIPYDTLHIYGYEGTESLAGSLSSLESSSTGSNLDYDFLSDWGPRFRTLAELYGVDGSDTDCPY